MARFVVIPVGISRYEAASDADIKAGRGHFRELPKVDSDLKTLAELFGSESYRKSGFEVRPVLTGTTGQITDSLNRLFADLGNEPALTVVLIWSGHGETPNGGDLRLATQESHPPMRGGEGFSPTELVNKLAGANVKAFCLVFDVCQAGAAVADVAQTAAKRFRETPVDNIRHMAALFSAQAFEEAEDGLFAEIFAQVLRKGPSPEALASLAEQGRGGFAYNRLLTMSDLGGVMRAEFELKKTDRPRVQTPSFQSIDDFPFFPNPLFKPGAPPVGVDAARRRWSRRDFEAHFLPKARGLEPSEEGWYFCGRAAVSRDIVSWLNRPGDAGAQGVYVLTGDGGTGKSAVIGRMVALSDPTFRQKEMPAAVIEKLDTVPEIGSLDAALHLRNLDLAQTVAGLSELLEIPVPQPEQIADWATALAPAKLDGLDRPVTVVLDALDEATEPSGIAQQLIQPLAARGWRFLVGTRRSAALRGATQLVPRVGPAHVRDLDMEETTEADIETYVKERLARTPGSPYAGHPADIATIGAKIAQNAHGRFLFARIAVSGLLERPYIPTAEIDETIGDSVGEALARDLDNQDKLFNAKFGRRGVDALLAALSWAQGEGLPLRDGLWTLVASTLQPQAPPFSDEHTQWVLVNLGRYIIESGDGEQAVYRLFHESLNEHFRAGHDPALVGGQIASVLLRRVEESGGWDHANPYVVRHLIAHFGAAHADLERVCTDPWYLRRALDLLGVDRLTEMLLGAWRRSRMTSIEAVAKCLQRARVGLSRDPGQLAAQLHARLASEDIDALKRLIEQLPRAAPRAWLRSRGASLGWRAALQTMQTFGAKVRALAFGAIDGAIIIAVGAGSEITMWSPLTGALPARTIGNDGLRVTGLALGSLGDREVLAAAAGYDGKLVIRDARTGAPIGEPIDCGYGPIAMGRFGARPAVAMPGARGYLVRTIDDHAPALEEQFAVAAVGQIGGALVGIEMRGDRHEVVDLATHQALGPAIELPEGVKVMAFGEIKGDPVLCHAGANAGWLRNLRTGRQLGNMFALDFPIRTLAIGEVESDCIVVAGNDTDNEGGYVAIRQPLTHEGAVRLPNMLLAWKPVLGVGLAKADAGRERTLVLLLEGVGAVDPLTWQIVVDDADDHASVELLSGAWGVPATISEPTPELENGRGYILRLDRPLQWPIKCSAWQAIDGRLLHVRGSYAGAVWIIDAPSGEIVAGPFRTLDKELRIWTRTKRAARSLTSPATAVALATWKGRAVVAVAYMGRVEVFDVDSGRLVGSPRTGASDIVAVALGESDARPLLATASSGGAVTVWEGPTMTRLASMTVDSGVRGVWFGGQALVVYVDLQFHVFDLVINA
jgi:Caspase domain